MIDNQVSDQLLARIANELSAPDVVFPTCFDITIRVHTLLKDPNVSLDRLAKALSAEPLMSAKIVRLANSVALKGGGREIADLKGAITRVGLEVVKTVSFAVAVEQLVRSKQMARFQAISHKIWEHSLLVAAIARLLARKTHMDPETAFLIGMVHDIGAFYLLFRCAADNVVAANEDDIVELVYEWHDGIGHALLTSLGQPEDITDAVHEHESLQALGNLRHWPGVLAVADRLAQRVGDWVPAALRAGEGAEIPEAILDADSQAELLQQGLSEIGTLEASLF